MAYGSIADIRLLGYIPEEELDALDAENVDRIPALFAAESGKFDTYLRPRYGVPWPADAVPIEIVDAIVAIVVFRLYIVRGFPSIPEGSEVAKEIIASRDRAEKFRQELRDGIAQLNWKVDDTPSALEAGVSSAVSLTPRQMMFCVPRRRGCC